jgi:hypothetical protein
LTLGNTEVASLLNQANHLFLRQITDRQNNSLRIVVEEAIVDASEIILSPDPTSPFSQILDETHPIRSSEKCNAFVLEWDHYVASLVTEEVVGSGGSHNDETYTGNLFRLYSQSHFLDHLFRDTGGHARPIAHYKLVCENHLIDVASYDPPLVRISDISR